METVASKVPFYQFAVLLDKISAQSGTERKKQFLRDFIDEWRAFHNKLHTASTTTDSFFPAMRLLLPQLDRDREAYGIKEHTLAKLYIEILGLGKDSPSAQKLVNYRSPKSAKTDAGDFAAIAYFILKPRCPDRGTLTIQDVNGLLDDVATGNASKDKNLVRCALGRLLRELSAREQKWLIRIIMKELKTGLNQQSVFSSYHVDAEDLYNVKMSLEKVCHILRDPAARLHEIEVTLFSPFRPMLGDRAAPNKVEQLLKNRPFFIEVKYDGERMQLHKRDGEFKYFSRSGNDYTHVYGGKNDDGNYTPYIADCFSSHVTSCILDGEMVGYNAETRTIASKGENFDVKSRDLAAAGYQPMLCVFDLLLLNGEVLANQPLRQRRHKLASVFKPVDGRLIYSDFTEKSSKQECIDALNDAIDSREEGIMIKDPESIYKPNVRKGGWYKVKPDYVGGLMDELDVLVVGGCFGIGSRSHMMSHFLCAVAVPSTDGQHPTIFHSFCRVGSGYTKKELFEFNRKLAAHWVPFDRKNPPSWLHLAAGLKQRPDAYIEPQHSAILQIRAAEIIASDQYKTGYTLRFPRVEKIRDDKPWYDCMTTVELDELRQKSAGKLAGQYVDQDIDEPKKKRSRVVKTVRPAVMSKFCGVNTAAVEKVGELFANKEFCVVSGATFKCKTDIERKIIEYGGSVVQNPDENIYCVLADKLSLKVRNIIAKGIYDVVHTNWLQRCIDQQKLLKWMPLDMMHMSQTTGAELALDYDQHGDSYYDDTDVDGLKKSFDKIEPQLLRPVSNEFIAAIEMQYYPHDSPYGLFRLCTDVSHVHQLHDTNRRRLKKFHIVLSAWVTDCISAGKLLDERSYQPVLDHSDVQMT